MKHIKGYSCEKTLESKKFFMEERTFNFWNPASPTDTVIGRILEIVAGWKAGYIAPSLIGRYRTFDKYDDYLLSFIYNKAPKKFRQYKLAQAVHMAVRFLDNIIDINTFLSVIYENYQKRYRTIDLGYTELADALVMLGYQYDTEAARRFVSKVTEFIACSAILRLRGTCQRKRRVSWVLQGGVHEVWFSGKVQAVI